MDHKPNQLKKPLMIVFLFATAVIGCNKEVVLKNPNDELQTASAVSSLEANGNSPAAHISASENLAIPASVSVPENLPNGNSRVATYYAVGVQKYKARIKAGSDPIVYEWVFVAPKADLYDISNTNVGTHGAGPFWSTSPLDSIFGQQFSPARTAPGTDPESIDWLLLMPKIGTTPTGIFADVDYIQRISTKGGKAPLTPPVSLTETVDVKYKAVYRFTKINP
ncbi:MAG TPA: DUF3455 domain-containing protein [Chitinophagaceae bacterium]|jgi:hypothetical protein|nr:DUF3455 domain-containing protein [Chitinophagaceae bacterium]